MKDASYKQLIKKINAGEYVVSVRDREQQVQETQRLLGDLASALRICDHPLVDDVLFLALKDAAKSTNIPENTDDIINYHKKIASVTRKISSRL